MLRADRGNGTVSVLGTKGFRGLRPRSLAIPLLLFLYPYLWKASVWREMWVETQPKVFSVPVGEAARRITGTAELMVSARGVFWSPATGSTEALFSVPEEER